jgi:POT family proton-dependent oligopeptide transporter
LTRHFALATAFSNYLAALIAMLTGVGHGDEGPAVLPPPQETVGLYGGVFGQIGIYACGAAVLLLCLSPLLTKWMHRDVEEEGASGGGGGH